MADSLDRWLHCLGFGERRCAHCGAPYFTSETSGASIRFCAECQKELLPYIGPACPGCGLPWNASAPKAGNGALCPNCRREKPPWHRIAYYGLYDGSLRDLLLRLKFDKELHLARPLAEFMLEASICLPRPDAIVAIPQHRAHLRRRGYNQAHELAKIVAKLGGFALMPDLLARLSQPRVQEGLNLAQRKLNLANAFLASPKAGGLSIWILDDVLTTGSTCMAACKELLGKGAARVCVLTVARTPLR